MDVRLVRVLAAYGVVSDSAILRGWGRLENGQLVSAAVAGGFTCLPTRDRLFAESAAKALKEHADFAVVIVRLPQKPWAEYEPQFRRAWESEPISPSPGKMVGWPGSAGEPAPT